VREEGRDLTVFSQYYKMKVKASKRAKKRYVVFEVISGELDDLAAHNAIKKAILGVHYQEAGIRFLRSKYRPRIHRGIFRVKNKYAKTVVNDINKTGNIRTVGMSGILKKAEEKYL